MPKKKLTFTSQILLSLHVAEDLLIPFFSVREFRDRVLYPGSYDSYRSIIYRLRKRGLIKFIKQEENRFVQLTRKGELEVLVEIAKLPVKGLWDGKWRVVIFDIPEEAKSQRDKLRRLLKENNFYKLQASVFISPYPLNWAAIEYLNKTGLNLYIRILRVDEIDDDTKLKKVFRLK